MKTITDNNRAAAIDTIIKAMNAPANTSENWNSGEDLSQMFGWDRSMSPITRAAFVNQYGEAVTAELEAAAVAKIAERAAIGTNYRAHAAEADKNAEKPAAELAAGDFVWALDTGLKFDHQRLTRHLEDFIEGEEEDAKDDGSDDYRHVTRRLCKIERVVDVADMGEALRTWQPAKRAEGEGYEGGSASDDIPEGWNVYGTDESKADRDAKLATFYTLGVLARTKSGEWAIIDAEGYDYPRYVLFPTDYRTMYAPQVTEIIARRERERLEAEEAARAKEAAERAAYDAMCAKWAPLMQPLNAEDYGENLKRARSNVLAMAKAIAPGVRFTLRRGNGWGEGWTLSWTNGPTVAELKAAAAFDLFCIGRDTFDGMRDMAEYEAAKYTDFANKYGAISNGVKFDRAEAATDRNRKPSAKLPEPPAEIGADGAASWNENPEKNGVEIRFTRKPDTATLDSLKAAGWRWSRFSRCWYNRATDAAREFARKIVAAAA